MARQIEPRLVPVKQGWAAVGDGWAVVGATRDEARKLFSAAEEKHAELRARDPGPSDACTASRSLEGVFESSADPADHLVG